jgi:hypothetical protein
VRVIPFDSPLVSIEAFHIEAHPTFAAVVERLPGLGRYAVVTNHAKTAIEVVVLRWSMDEGSAMSRKAMSAVHEGFSNPPYQPVVPPNGRKLVTDAGLLPENLPEHFALVGGGSVGVYQTVEIDSAIFDDWSLVGPDRYGVVKHIREQHAVAEELLAAIDERLASGRTLQEIVSGLDDAPYEGRQGVWRDRLIRNLRRNHSFLDYLRRQRKLPPNFPR